MRITRGNTALNAKRGAAALTVFGLLAAALTLISGQSGAAADETLPVPSADPFYAAPANLASLANGSIIRSRQVGAKVKNGSTNVPLTAWQVAYRSTDNHDQAITSVTTLLVPQAAWKGKGLRPAIAYVSAEDSLGSQCAPSYTLATNSSLLTGQEASVMAQALQQGITLAVADYEGPNSAYLVGLQSARIVLDGVRAAKQFTTAGLSAATPFGLWGYSGGGHAAAWTAELNASYAPDVTFAGASVGGMPWDLTNSFKQMNGGPFVGFALAALVGLAHGNPDWNIQGQLTANGKAVYAKVDGKCTADFVVNVAFTRLNDMTVQKNAIDLPVNQALIRADDLGKAKPTMPMYLYYSYIDEAVPTADSQAMIRKYCSWGVPVTSEGVFYADHYLLGSVKAGAAVSYLADRFNGKPVTSNC